MLSTAYHSTMTKVNNYVTSKPVDWVKLFSELATTEEEKIILYYVCCLSYPEDLANIYQGYLGITTPMVEELPQVVATEPPTTKPKPAKQAKTYILVNESTKEEIEVSGASLTKDPSPIGQVLSKGEKDKIIYYGKTINGWYNKAGKLL